MPQTGGKTRAQTSGWGGRFCRLPRRSLLPIPAPAAPGRTGRPPRQSPGGAGRRPNGGAPPRPGQRPGTSFGDRRRWPRRCRAVPPEPRPKIPWAPPAAQFLPDPAGTVAPVAVVPGHQPGVGGVVDGPQVLQPVGGGLDLLLCRPPALEFLLQFPAGEGPAAGHAGGLGADAGGPGGGLDLRKAASSTSIPAWRPKAARVSFPRRRICPSSSSTRKRPSFRREGLTSLIRIVLVVEVVGAHVHGPPGGPGGDPGLATHKFVEVPADGGLQPVGQFRVVPQNCLAASRPWPMRVSPWRTRTPPSALGPVSPPDPAVRPGG